MMMNIDMYRTHTYELTKKSKKNLFWNIGSSKYHDMNRGLVVGEWE